VGLEDALGADAVTHPDTELDGESALRAFLTLGLLTRPPPKVQTRWTAFGDYATDREPADFHTGPPYEPIDRALPGDVYWMAKQIAAVPDASVAGAIEGARITDAATRAALAEVIRGRRQKLVADAYGRVSPCEVERVEPGRVTLRDEAIVEALATAAERRYAIAYLDSEGKEFAAPVRLMGEGAKVRVPIPAGGEGYVVVRLGVEQGKQPAPRAMEMHLVRRGGVIRLVGVRH